MFLTITSTAADAADLGFLLHKQPGRVQSLEVLAMESEPVAPRL